MSPEIKTFFHKDTFSLTYLVIDSATNESIIIDPVMDFNVTSASTGYASAQKVMDEINARNLKLCWVLETHAHADHLTAAQWFKRQTGAQIAIGKQISRVQNTFNQLYGFTGNNLASKDDFDRLLDDQEEIKLGELTIKTIHTPGHTPSCSTYIINHHAFVGDTLFMPDFGTSRCDFPGGNARKLYQSIQKILALPKATQLYMCHDYMPNGRELLWQSTVAQQKEKNIHIHQGISEDEFIKLRTQRDLQLPVPKLLLSALQINIRAGKFPTPEGNNQTSYLKLPLNVQV